MDKLLNCPFCGGEMMFRKALWPSDGNVDAVLHRHPTDCGLGEFSNDRTDESVIAVWNRRSSPDARVSVGDGCHKALAALVAKIEELTPDINGMFQMAQIHGARWDANKNWVKELADAKVALAAAPKPQSHMTGEES